MVVPKVTTSVCGLKNHLLPRGRARGKSELIASTAPVRLGLARDSDGAVAVGQSVAHGPWDLVVAHVGDSAVAARLCVDICQDVVVCIAGLDGRCHCGLVLFMISDQ